MLLPAHFMLLPILLTLCPQLSHSRPSQHNGYTTDGTELIVVEEIVRCTRQDLHELCQNDTMTTANEHQQQQQQQNKQHTSAIRADNESVMDLMDDLILLDQNKPKQAPQSQQQQRKEKSNLYGTYQQQSELLTSAAAREDTLVAAAAAAPAIGDPSDSTALGSSYHQESFDSGSDSDANSNDDDDDNNNGSDGANTKTTDVDAVNAAAADELIADGVLFHGVLLRLADGPHSVPQPVPPLDMSDFLALIPAEEVKSIASNYYRNDVEVRRAYAYLSGRNFIALREEIVASPEVGAFLQYLNISGFDLMKFVSTVANLTTIGNDGEESRDTANNLLEQQQQQEVGNSNGDTAVIVVNEISKVEHNAPSSTSIDSTPPPKPDIFDGTTSTPTPTTNFDEAKTQKELNGLHGLVDSILEILPQDQILSTFFDKLETDENFRKFVNNIQKPAFAQILSKMEQSMSLRNLIFTLHNNGIYVARIVESLKAYFFLGGFS